MLPATLLTKAVTTVDKRGVDGAVNGLGTLSQKIGALVTKTQTGYVRGYASYILGGVILALVIVLVTRF